jgi:hypothetical protein
MCRNIRPLFNFDPPATDDEFRAAALQYVRKISGFTRSSQINQPAFDTAIEVVASASRDLIASLQTSAPPRNRALVAARARARSARRFDSTDRL